MTLNPVSPPKSSIGSLPRQVYLEQLAAAEYKLKRPLLLEVTVDEDDQTLVSHLKLDIFGAGHTLDEALGDFQSMLVEVFEELEASDTQLSTPLQQRLTDLKEIMAHR